MFFKYLSAMIIIGFIVCDQASSKISDYNPFRCLANAKTINCPVDGRLTVNPSAKKVKTLKKMLTQLSGMAKRLPFTTSLKGFSKV